MSIQPQLDTGEAGRAAVTTAAAVTLQPLRRLCSQSLKSVLNNGGCVIRPYICMRVHLACESPTRLHAIIAIITARLSQSGERMDQLGLIGGRKSGFPFGMSALDDAASGKTPAVAQPEPRPRVLPSRVTRQVDRKRCCIWRMQTRKREFRCRSGVE